MKKLWFLILCVSMPILAFSSTAYSYEKGVFTLFPDSLWKDKNLPLLGKNGYKPTSIGYVPSKLGYQEDEWYMWYNDKFDTVIFKAFTQTPICVIINNDSTEEFLSSEQFEAITKGYNYDDAFNVFRKAADSEIRQSVVEEALGVKVKDGIINDDAHKFKYYFTNGYLTKAVSEDGYTEYAYQFRDSELFDKIKTNAFRKHEDKSKAIDEINFQFDCWARMTPKENKYAYGQPYNYNLAFIWFLLYGPDKLSSLSDFLLCMPDAQKIEENDETVKFKWMNGVFVFKNGILTESSLD